MYWGHALGIMRARHVTHCYMISHCSRLCTSAIWNSKIIICWFCCWLALFCYYFCCYFYYYYLNICLIEQIICTSLLCFQLDVYFIEEEHNSLVIARFSLFFQLGLKCQFIFPISWRFLMKNACLFNLFMPRCPLSTPARHAATKRWKCEVFKCSSN